jgi:hypothetical protein
MTPICKKIDPAVPANPIAAIPEISIASQSLRDISRTTILIPGVGSFVTSEAKPA